MIIVLTGSSNAGKTTLLSTFSKDFLIIPETSREIMDKHLNEKKLDLLYIQKQIVNYQYNLEKNLIGQKNFILDRSLIDYISFAEYFKLDLGLSKKLTPPIKYDFVFLLNQREKTVQTDFLDVSSVLQEKYLKEGYEKLRYSPISVPFMNTDKRKKFIEDLI